MTTTADSLQSTIETKAKELNFLSKKYDNLKNRMFALQKEMQETDLSKIKVHHELFKLMSDAQK